MSGRGMGYCAGYDVPGYANRGAGMGMGRGVRGGGRGRGWRNQYYATGMTGWQRAERSAVEVERRRTGPAQSDELVTLRAVAEEQRQALAELTNRLEKLEAQQARSLKDKD